MIMQSRARSNVVLVVAGVLLGLIVFLTASANNRAADNQQSVSNLAQILNRRSPTLEYLACKDVAHDAFDVAQGRLVLALVNRDQASVPGLVDAYEQAIEAVQKSQRPKAEGGCGDLPLPADAPTKGEGG